MPLYTGKLRSYCDQSEVLSDLSDLSDIDDDDMAVDDEGTVLPKRTKPKARREEMSKSTTR